MTCHLCLNRATLEVYLVMAVSKVIITCFYRHPTVHGICLPVSKRRVVLIMSNDVKILN